MIAGVAGHLSPRVRLRLPQRDDPEVRKMGRCALCKKRIPQSELIGRLCNRCDHIQGNVMADLQAEFRAAGSGADETG